MSSNNLAIIGAQSHLERRLNRACLTGMAYRSLREEFIDALSKGPQTMVRTPGYGVSEMSVADVVNDFFAGEGDEPLHGLLRILKLAATLESPMELQRMALDAIDALAERHANFHADDAAREDEEAA